MFYNNGSAVVIDQVNVVTVAALWVGIITLLTSVIRYGCRRVQVPALVGFLALGLGLRMLDNSTAVFSGTAHEILRFLANLGIIALLFRVGLTSRLRRMKRQLPRATRVWFVDVVINGLLAYWTARWVAGFAFIPSLVLAAALATSSVGVSANVWRRNQAHDTPQGQLLLDAAELDCLTGVLLMALLFALLPALYFQYERSLGTLVLKATGWILIKLVLFGAACLLFSRYGARSVTKIFEGKTRAGVPMLVVVSIGFSVAAFAGVIGLSVAVGAFFSGLMFSRDPHAVEINAAFDPLYDFLMPFFFVGIGLKMVPGDFPRNLGPALALFGVAVLGKFLTVGGVGLLILPPNCAALLGVSMMPRAEIALVIMQHSARLGSWAVPTHAFSALVLVSALTCAITPIALRPLMRRWRRQTRLEPKQA